VSIPLGNNVSLLIPAHNEEFTIEKLLIENIKILEDFKQSGVLDKYEVTVLDDGSTDNTLEILNKINKKYDIKIFNNKSPTGIESAFNFLYSKVNMDWYILIPGDAQWPPEATRVILETFNEKIEFSAVNGIRTNKKTVYSFRRRLISWLYAKLGDVILRTKNSDPGSIKLLPREIIAMKKLTSGMATEIESLLLAQVLKNKKIKIVPVPWVKRQQGKESGASLENIFKTVFSIPKLFLARIKIVGFCWNYKSN